METKCLAFVLVLCISRISSTTTLDDMGKIQTLFELYTDQAKGQENRYFEENGKKLYEPVSLLNSMYPAKLGDTIEMRQNIRLMILQVRNYSR